jgi:CxxC motif-containing protein (DUF1111 family)
MHSGRIAAAATGLSLLVAFAGIATGDAPGAAAGTARSDNLVARDAFLQPLGDLPFEKKLDFAVGQALFERLWVAAPASTKSADGLGPLFNARSCESCHVRNGRGAVPVADGGGLGLVMRLSVPADDGAALPEPTYGEQLQDLAIAGQKAEGRLHVEYQPLPVRLADGEIVELQQPHYSVTDPAFGPLDPAAMLSPRLAPPVIGLGLVAMIPEAQIVAAADPDDRDGDGIAGRPNFVSTAPDGATALGRFGWKAGHATLDQQIAQALSLDIGISSALAPAGYGDCTAQETACRAAPDGNTPTFGNVEAPEQVTRAIRFYVESLAVPAARDSADPQVQDGQALFAATGCTACHRPHFVTAADPARPELSRREIFPYSDFLLHDMGAGLADSRPEGLANGREWRTAPLWGLGRTPTVNGHAYYLHDGRARDLMEAILWHDGEAAAAKRRFMDLSKQARSDLLRFLESL